MVLRTLALFILCVLLCVYFSLPIEDLKDYGSYIASIRNTLDYFSQLDFLDINIIVLEPLWRALLTVMVFLFKPLFTYMTLALFGGLLVFIYVVKRLNFSPLYIPLLMSPIFITNHLVHIRQGLGLAIFLWAFHYKNRINLLLLSSPLVHVVYFPLVALFKFPKLRYLLPFFLIFIPFMNKSGDYLYTKGFGVGFVIWLGHYFWIRLSARNHFLEGAIISYLCLYILIDISIAARFIESVAILLYIHVVRNVSSVTAWIYAVFMFVFSWVGRISLGGSLLGYGL